jgi:hypothetical protein
MDATNNHPIACNCHKCTTADREARLARLSILSDTVLGQIATLGRRHPAFAKRAAEADAVLTKRINADNAARRMAEIAQDRAL